MQIRVFSLVQVTAETFQAGLAHVRVLVGATWLLTWLAEAHESRPSNP